MAVKEFKLKRYMNSDKDTDKKIKDHSFHIHMSLTNIQFIHSNAFLINSYQLQNQVNIPYSFILIIENLMNNKQQFDNKSDSSKQSQSFNLSTAHSQVPFYQKTIQRKPENRTFQRRKRLTQRIYRKEDFASISPPKDMHQEDGPKQDAKQQYSSSFVYSNNSRKQQHGYSFNHLSRISIGPVKFNKRIQGDEKLQNTERIKQNAQLDEKNELAPKNEINQIKKLKQTNEKLQKKVQRLGLQLNKVKLQNVEMQKKILSYQQQIYKLKKKYQILEKQLSKSQNNKKVKLQFSQCLQQIIAKLNQKIDHLIFQNQSLENQKCQILEDFSQSIGKTQQAHNFIQKIQSNMKYLQIQNHVLKRKLQQCDQKQDSVQFLTQSNRKLQAKVDQFHKFRKNVLEQQNCRHKNSKNRDDDIMFFLSPEN